MKCKLSSLEFLMLVYYFVKFNGLAPFTIRNNRFHPPTLFGKFYPVLVGASYLLFVSFTFTSASKIHYSQGYSLHFKIWGGIGYFTSITTVLGTLAVFFLMHKNIVFLLNKLCTISNKIKSLGIEEDHEKFFENLFVTAIISNAILIVIWIFIISTGSYLGTRDIIKNCIDECFGLNVVLIFSGILNCIRQRFALVNKKLHDLSIPVGSLRFPHNSRIFFMSNWNHYREENQLRSEGFVNYLQCTQNIETLHMELSDLLHQATHLFATPIVLKSIQWSVHFVLYWYQMYSKFLKSSQFTFVDILSPVLRMVSMSLQLFIVAHASAKICEQGNATKAVLFKVWNKFTLAELKDEGRHRMFSKFSDQLLHTTVAVSAFGFIDLGYSLIFKIFGTVITYLIIVIQFDASHASP